jgi:hypothetical protein
MSPESMNSIVNSWIRLFNPWINYLEIHGLGQSMNLGSQIQRFVDAGAFTYKYSILGSSAVPTADPKNIQVRQLPGEIVPILDISGVVYLMFQESITPEILSQLPWNIAPTPRISHIRQY